jgi:hypothetical protein
MKAVRSVVPLVLASHAADTLPLCTPKLLQYETVIHYTSPVLPAHGRP